MPAETATEQQTGVPANAAATAPAPVQTPAPVQQAQAVQAQATPAPDAGAQNRQAEHPEETWEQRYRGVMTHLNTVNAQREAAERQAHEATTAAATMQEQLQQWQSVAQQSQAQLAQVQAQAAEAMREAAYMALVNTEYPDLVQIAGALQRMDTPDQQRQLFDTVRQQLGTRVAAAATQQVAQQYAGVTPGGAPAPGTTTGPGALPSREQVMDHVMDENLRRNDPRSYEQWMEVYRAHPEMTPASLGRTWQDPFPNDYRQMQVVAGQTPAPLGQRHTVQNPEAGPGMPGAFGGTQPPGPGRGDPWTQGGGS